MRNAICGLTLVAILAACQAPDPALTSATSASADGTPVASSDATRSTSKIPSASPNKQTPVPFRSEVASWETSYPFSLAMLVEQRLRSLLAVADRRRIDVAAAHALADERGTLHRWRTDARDHHGIVRLIRRSAPANGRVCARLHHEHQLGRRTLRGSVRICRKRGDSAAPWRIDDVRWIRLGNDLAGVTNVDLSADTPS